MRWRALQAEIMRRDHADERLGPTLLARAPNRLPIDRNDVPAEPGERRHPGDEAVLKLLRIESREDMVELVMRGRAVLEMPEAVQEAKLLLTERGDLQPGFAPGEYPAKEQQHDFINRIERLGVLARFSRLVKCSGEPTT